MRFPGPVSKKTIYKGEDCDGCSYKSECIKGNHCKTPVEERTKTLQVAKTDLKQDMQFRRYLSKGNANVLAESTLLAMARNINKLHNKIQNGRTGTHLFSIKSA